MNKFLRFVLFCCGVVLLCYDANAQVISEKRITMKLDSAHFQDFVSQIEQQTEYFFYYDTSKFDSLTVDIEVHDLPVNQVLDQVLSGSDFTYAIDDQKRIYITEGRAIITSLKPKISTDGTVDGAALQYEGLENAALEKLLSTAETKVHDIGTKSYRITAGQSTLTGYVRDAVTGQPVIGAAIFTGNPVVGVTTDALGLYALPLPRGKHILKITSTGMRETQRQIVLYSNGKLDIEMRESVVALKEVKVKSGMDKNVVSKKMGQVK